MAISPADGTRVLRAVAILLITQSHLDGLYPVPMLATGGALGNALFFMLSGYGLAKRSPHGSQAGSPGRFWPWLHRRLTRLYPSLWLTVLVLGVLAQGHWQTWQWGDYLRELIYPTRFWFISAMVLFYLLIYPVLTRSWLRQHLGRWLLLLAGVYLAAYVTVVDMAYFSVEGPGGFKWIYYFALMRLGVHLADAQDDATPPRRRDVWALGGCLAGFFALKAVFSQGWLLPAQCLAQWILLPTVVYALRVARSPRVTLAMAHPAMAPIVLFLAGTTLEIYLTQSFLYRLPWLVALPFPLNVGVFALLCAVAAWAIRKLAQRMQQVLGRGLSAPAAQEVRA